MPYPFYIVDVFAETRYAGNQLAVFPNAASIPNDELQAIAREMNYSETTFIFSKQAVDGAWPVRIFTPSHELPFAGHPTLGTGSVIRYHLTENLPATVELDLRVGRIPVTFESGGMSWMRQNPPEFGPTVDPSEVAAALGLEVSCIDTRYPCQVVSTGTPFILAPLKALKDVRSADLQPAAYLELIEKLDSKAILLFAPETYDSSNDINARMFAPYHGVAEDAATGSANGCLAGYACRHRYLGSSVVDARVEQGYEIQRPSLLYLKADENPYGITVDVGGRVVLVALGEFV